MQLVTKLDVIANKIVAFHKLKIVEYYSSIQISRDFTLTLCIVFIPFVFSWKLFFSAYKNDNFYGRYDRVEKDRPVVFIQFIKLILEFKLRGCFS